MMRGGTSKGPFFLASDLPDDIAQLHRTLLAVMGSEHIRQIDGIGGGDSLTSKALIVGRSKRPGIDVEYLFAQVAVGGDTVDTAPNCGNMLSAVGPFAIERGLVTATIAANDIAHLQSQHRQDDRGDSANARRQGHL